MSTTQRNLQRSSSRLVKRLYDAMKTDDLSYDEFDAATRRINDVQRSYQTGAVDLDRALNQLHDLEADLFE